MNAPVPTGCAQCRGRSASTTRATAPGCEDVRKRKSARWRRMPRASVDDPRPEAACRSQLAGLRGPRASLPSICPEQPQPRRLDRRVEDALVRTRVGGGQLATAEPGSGEVDALLEATRPRAPPSAGPGHCLRVRHELDRRAGNRKAAAPEHPAMTVSDGASGNAGSARLGGRGAPAHARVVGAGWTAGEREQGENEAERSAHPRDLNSRMDPGSGTMTTTAFWRRR